MNLKQYKEWCLKRIIGTWKTLFSERGKSYGSCVTTNQCHDRHVSLVVRASTSQSVDLWFDFLAKSDQETLFVLTAFLFDVQH